METPNISAVPSGDEREVLELACTRWGQPEAVSGEAMVGRCVIGQKDSQISPDYDNVDARDARIGAVSRLLGCWPEGAASIGQVVTVFWPITHRQYCGGRGSTSGHEITSSGHRAAYVTVDDPYGCAEGLWHEYGHIRLRAMGIDLETHDGWLLDHRDDEMFVSPIRRDKLRPMSAVLHGVYCWVALSQGDVYLWRAGHPDQARVMLFLNLPKIEEGILTLRRLTRWTAAGKTFGAELLAWAEDVASEGWGLLGMQHRPEALASNLAWIRGQPVSRSLLHDDDL